MWLYKKAFSFLGMKGFIIIGAILVALVGGYIGVLKWNNMSLTTDLANEKVKVSKANEEITNLKAKIEIVSTDLSQSLLTIDDTNKKLKAIEVDREAKIKDFNEKQKTLEGKLATASKILSTQSRINDLNITTPEQRAKVLDAVRAVDVLYGFGQLEDKK
jgi:chromosome segregation ATPase